MRTDAEGRAAIRKDIDGEWGQRHPGHANDLRALLEDLDEMMALYCIALAIIDKPGEVLDVDRVKAREVAVRKFGEPTAAVLFGARPAG